MHHPLKESLNFSKKQDHEGILEYLNRKIRKKLYYPKTVIICLSISSIKIYHVYPTETFYSLFHSR